MPGYKKSAKKMFLIYIVFLICVLPFTCVLVMSTFMARSTTVETAFNFTMSLVFINSSMNPFLYCILMSDLRREVRNMLVIVSGYFSQAGRRSWQFKDDDGYENVTLRATSRLFHLVPFVKCWQMFLELAPKRQYRISEKRKSLSCGASSTRSSCVGAVRKVSLDWSQKTMTCHSFNCFSIVWGQG